MPLRLRLLASVSACSAGLLAFVAFDPPKPAIGQMLAVPVEPTFTPNPELRQALFGELHLHTSFSYDAWGFGQGKLGPDDAYRFASGQAVTLLGREVRRDRPLDFMAVTDHSEFMGVLNQLDDPANPLSTTTSAAALRANPFKTFLSLYYHMHKGTPLPELNIPQAMRDAWARQVAAANAHYVPGKFTTFIGYEWTSMPGGVANLHRNVIFSGAHAPPPFTSNDSERPEDLWSYLENVRKTGLDVLAIPHNGNASGGLMYDWVDSDRHPISESYAQRRAANEPLSEIYQVKGASESHPSLSPNDEFASFEKWDKFLVNPRPSNPNGSYARDAFGRGLVIQRRVGANPYKFGVVAASDVHNALSASSENASSGHDTFDPKSNPPARDGVEKLFRHGKAFDFMAERETEESESGTRLGSAGLTGVWAEQNTRSAIFASLRRRETFGTSGTRLRLRFFGGWNFAPALLRRPDWAKRAYADGVPMGSDLARAPNPHAAPRFLLWAVKDPNDANLDRIQVVKIWLEGSSYREKIFDVAWSGKRRIDPLTGKLPSVGTTVDLEFASYTNAIGTASLQAVWRDPEFDAAMPAVYYARVLQIPTPRWTTYLAVKYNLPLPADSPATIQERAWSSPIWYTPALPERRARMTGHGHGLQQK